MIFDVHDPNVRLFIWIVLILSLIAFIIIIILTLKSSHKKIVSGKEGLINQVGIVLEVTNEKISVLILGEIWEADSPYQLTPKQKIKVIRINGLILTVVPTLKKISGEN